MSETPDVEQQPSEKNTVGPIDPSIWDEQQAVTGRPNDTAPANSTFAERAKAAAKPDVESVDKPAKAAGSKRKA